MKDIKVMKEELLKNKESIEKFFREEEYLEITNMDIKEDGKVRLDYIESCGGGMSSVGDFDMEYDKLISLVR